MGTTKTTVDTVQNIAKEMANHTRKISKLKQINKSSTDDSCSGHISNATFSFKHRKELMY